jgi:DNA helicase-2/ATP-dependent DNA helicase PcrA
MPAKNQKKVQEGHSAGNDFTSPAADEIQTGMKIEHRKFGKGKVISTEGNGSNKKATVFFTHYGQKQLLLKFAKIKIL